MPAYIHIYIRYTSLLNLLNALMGSTSLLNLLNATMGNDSAQPGGKTCNGNAAISTKKWRFYPHGTEVQIGTLYMKHNKRNEGSLKEVEKQNSTLVVTVCLLLI